jgi:hypothetical protein
MSKVKLNKVTLTPEQVEEVAEQLSTMFSGPAYVIVPVRRMVNGTQYGTDVWDLQVHDTETMEYLPHLNFPVRVKQCTNGWSTSVV